MSLWVVCRQRLFGRYSVFLFGCRPRCPINAVCFAICFLFILLCSEKNERGKRRRGYRAIRSDADASFVGCGTRSAQTVLAFFPPRLSPLLPDKCGLLRNMFLSILLCSAKNERRKRRPHFPINAVLLRNMFFVHSSQQREERTGKAPPRLSGFSLGRRRGVCFALRRNIFYL